MISRADFQEQVATLQCAVICVRLQYKRRVCDAVFYTRMSSFRYIAVQFLFFLHGAQQPRITDVLVVFFFQVF